MKPLSQLSSRLQGQPMFQILQRAKELERQGKEIIHFELGDPDFDTPDNIIRRAMGGMWSGQTHYCPSRGMRELLEAAQYVTKKSRGFSPAIEQLLVTPGANSQIYYALAVICNPGDRIIVPDPGFVSYFSIASMLDIEVDRVPLLQSNAFHSDVDEIKKRITNHTKAVIINSPSNPTGAVMTPEEIKAVYDLCEHHDLYLLSDEIYARMIYGDVEFSSPSRYDQCKERVIIINGFSKSFSMTGWRLGVVTGPEKVIEKMTLALETVQSCVPPFIQAAGVQALLGDQWHIDSMMKEYKERRDVMYEGLISLPGMKCEFPEGAFYCFPNVSDTGMNGNEFSDFMLEKAGVALTPGFVFGRNSVNNVRLCYANSIENIIKGIEKMREVL